MEDDAPTLGLSSTVALPSPAFAAGQRVAGRYRIVRFLAQGGMGEVYEAEDLELRGRVALKALRPEIAGEAVLLERFKREISLARQVTHPNVARTFDIGRDGATTFLTMELLHGETLSERLGRGGRMEPALALPLVEQMVAGLAAAHRAGVVHRDFKPRNVVLASDEAGGERVVVTDFGLARSSVRGVGDADTSLTASGLVMGTAPYMSPEQVVGEPVTPASDVYALGIVLYEIVTGTRPFSGDTPLSTAVKRLQQPPPSPRRHVPELSPVWERVILRCLERDPARRFARVEDVAAALRGEAVPPAPASGRWRRGLAAGALALAVAVSAWLARPRPPGPAPPAPVAKARRSVAVLGFKDLSGRAESAWLATALAEMFTTELAAGETLRLLPGEDVARVRADLGLTRVESPPADTLGRIREQTGVDLIVLGSYLTLEQAAGNQLRLDLRLQETSAGDTVAAVTETGSEADLFALVSRAGVRLRQALGVAPASDAQSQAARAALPQSPGGARFYAEGVARLRQFEPTAARDLLQKAVAADPGSALAHSALAAAWSALGYHERARDEARRAFELSAGLQREERLVVEGRYREAVGERDKAVEIHRTLSVFFPDNLDYGLRLAASLTDAGRASEALDRIAEMRRLPSPAGDDARLDLAEAKAAEAMGDLKRTRDAAQRATAKGQARGARQLVARGLAMQAWAVGRLGDPEAAKGLDEQARALFAALGDRDGVATTRNHLANLLSDQGDLAGARRVFEEFLAVEREIGNRDSQGAAFNNIANAQLEQGDLDGARHSYEQALAAFREVRDRRRAALPQGNLGLLYLDLGDLAAARRSLEEALETSKDVGDRVAEALSTYGIGLVLAAQGDLAGAGARLEHAVGLSRPMNQRFVGYGLLALGEVLMAQGDLAGARSRLEESLAIRTRIGATLNIAETRMALAALALAEGKPAEAEGLAKQAADELGQKKAAGKQALAEALLARALAEEGRTSEGRETASRARARVGVTRERARALLVRAVTARIEPPAQALPALASVVDEARRLGLVAIALDARLALGEAELRAGHADAGRTRLAALAKEARALGFGLVARQAEERGRGR